MILMSSYSTVVINYMYQWLYCLTALPLFAVGVLAEARVTLLISLCGVENVSHITDPSPLASAPSHTSTGSPFSWSNSVGDLISVYNYMTQTRFKTPHQPHV